MTIAAGESQVFRQMVYRPYLDLGHTISDAPFHVIGLDWSIDTFLTGNEHPFIQASVNESFRPELTVSPLQQYAVESLTDLPDDLQSDRARHFIAELRTVTPGHDNAKFYWVLSRLGFHRSVRELLPRKFESSDSWTKPSHSELTYLYHWTRFRLWLDDPTVDYAIDGFIDVATRSHPCRVKVDATYQIVMQNAKFSGSYDACEYWQNKHKLAIIESESDFTEDERARLWSRYHRVGGFLPQMRQDIRGVTREMEQAEQTIRNVASTSPSEEVARLEMLYPCIESRMQEALWMGDTDRALTWVNEYIEMKQLDPKGWLHRANIHLRRDDLASAAADFACAATLAPPGRSVASFMRGQCLAGLGDLDGALECYLRTIDDDPLAVSAVDAAYETAKDLGRQSMLPWLKARQEELRGMAAVVPDPPAEPYKHIAAPETPLTGRP